MKKTMTALLVLAGGSMGVIGCSAETGPTQPGSAVAPSVAAEGVGALKLTVADSHVSGSYVRATDTVSFDAQMGGGGVYTVTVHAHGLTLDALIDPKQHTASYDGFTTASGADSLLTEDDQALLAAFDRELVAHLSPAIKNGNLAGDFLTRALELWTEWPSTLTLQRRVMGEENRSYVSWCANLNTAMQVTHNCNRGNSWDAIESAWAYIGDYNGDGPTYYWNGSAWVTSTPDHLSWPTEYGSCYGRCGSGCTGTPGAPGGPHIYTQDCGNHDDCVRNGHVVTSLYCADEFGSTTDDATYAPNCY